MDQELLATAGADAAIRLWSPRNLFVSQGERIGHQGDVRAVAFAGSTLISGGSDGTVRRWVAGRTPAVDVISEGSLGVLDIDGTDTHDEVVAATRAGALLWWSKDRGGVVVDAHSDRAWAVRLLSTGDIISESSDGRVLRTTRDGDLDMLLELLSEIRSLAVTGDELFAHVGDEDGGLHEINLVTGRSRMLGRLGAPIRALEVLPVGNGILAGTSDGTLWMLETTDDARPSQSSTTPVGRSVISPPTRRAISWR